MRIILSNYEFNKLLINSLASASIPNLSAGSKNINVVYSGDKNYTGTSKSQSVKIWSSLFFGSSYFSTKNSKLSISSLKSALLG